MTHLDERGIRGVVQTYSGITLSDEELAALMLKEAQTLPPTLRMKLGHDLVSTAPGADTLPGGARHKRAPNPRTL